jgi:uncharacterized coiled-coil DUF342 family protein
MEPGLYTFEEASRMTGLSIAALRKRASRPGKNRLETVTSNEDKLLRVRIDDRTIDALKRVEAGRSQNPADIARQDIVKLSSTLSKAVDVLQEQLAGLRSELDATRGEVARERGRADMAEEKAAAAIAEAERRAEELSAAKEQLARAEGVLEGMQQMQQADARSWWQRLLAVTKGRP